MLREFMSVSRARSEPNSTLLHVCVVPCSLKSDTTRVFLTCVDLGSISGTVSAIVSGGKSPSCSITIE